MAALQYAAIKTVRSLVILATPYRVKIANCTINVLNFAEKCSNVLIMHGLKDKLILKEQANIIYKRVSEPKKLLFFDTDHSFSDKKQRELALKEAMKWFEKYLSIMEI